MLLQEVGFFSDSLKELRGGQQRFASAREAVKALSKEVTDGSTTALVPLTESVRNPRISSKSNCSSTSTRS